VSGELIWFVAPLPGPRHRQRAEALPSVVCLLAARLNHSCAPNAAHWYEPLTAVKLVTATTAIAAGQEILISYLDPADAASPEEHAAALKSHWGIECGPACLCRDASYLEKRHRLEDLLRGFAATKSLTGMEHTRALQEELGMPAIVVLQALHSWGEVCVARRCLLPQAQRLADEAAELAKSAFGPASSVAAFFEPFAKDVSKHRNYLALDRSTVASDALDCDDDNL